jgi:hypothetical protein
MHLLYLRYFKYVDLSFCRGHHGMGLFFLPSSAMIFRKEPFHLLAFAWIAGLVSGFVIALGCIPINTPLMRQLPYGMVSIVGMTASVSFPLLISAFADFISCNWLLAAVIAIKGFSYSFVCASVIGSFGTSGWLLWLFFAFADTMSLPILWLYWLGSGRQGRRDLCFRLVPAISACFLICSVDIRFVIPYLQEILFF